MLLFHNIILLVLGVIATSIFLLFIRIVIIPIIQLKWYNFKFSKDTYLCFVPIGGLPAVMLRNFQYHYDSAYMLR